MDARRARACRLDEGLRLRLGLLRSRILRRGRGRRARRLSERHLGLARDRQVALLDAVEERVETEVHALRAVVVLVVVAFGASHREPEPYGRRRVRAVDRLLDAVFVRISAALGVVERVPMKTRRDEGTRIVAAQEVARELLDREAV